MDIKEFHKATDKKKISKKGRKKKRSIKTFFYFSIPLFPKQEIILDES